jgi:hypothetical protein
MGPYKHRGALLGNVHRTALLIWLVFEARNILRKVREHIPYGISFSFMFLADTNPLLKS